MQAQDADGAVHVLLGNHEQYLIGHWLRQQPVIIKSGQTVITHGGVSPGGADSGLTVGNLNSAMRRYWSGDMPSKNELDAVVGPAGVTQYRGYLY